jgi:hypothetical protein
MDPLSLSAFFAFSAANHLTLDAEGRPTAEGAESAEVGRDGSIIPLRVLRVLRG